MSDTIFALSSGRPPAAVSIIRVSGPRAHAAGQLLAGTLPDARTAAVRSLHHPVSGDLLDQALLLRFDAPASSTGEDVVEFQCHGGRAIIDALLGALAEVGGLRSAAPGEFTRRAFENGRIDLTEAEGLADLIEAETESQRKAALALAEGGLKKQIAAWQDRLLSLSANVELMIDYDDDDSAVDPAVSSGIAALADDLQGWLDQPRAERLKDGVLVVVAGPPNAGKSSLINAIVGEDRTIVTPVPGTTRDYIEVPIALGGVPMRLTDTAGIRVTDDEVEAIGVGRARQLVEAADVLVWLGGDGPPPHSRVVAVRSKADLPSAQQANGEALPVSSLTGEGLPRLIERLLEGVRALLPSEGAVALNRRQADHLAEATAALRRAAHESDPVLIAEELRHARTAFDRLTGRAGVEDVLDSLFGRFCLGK